MPYYDDDEDIDIHVRHRAPSPARPVRYVPNPPRPRDYYAAGPSYLVPENRTTVVARSRSLSRSRDRRESPPQAANPVIINNRIYNDPSSSDDSDSDYERERRRRRRREKERRRDRSSSSSRSRSRNRNHLTQKDWEAEQARRELEQLRIAAARDENERRLAKEYKDDADLQRAKRELDEIKKREKASEEEKRIKKELELKRLKEEEEAAEEKRRRDKEARDAVERYKKEEMERMAMEVKQREATEKEYRRRLQEDLVQSGVDEKAIAAILKKEKVPEAQEEQQKQQAVARPTYTRMARRHLSIETLRTFHIEFDLDGVSISKSHLWLSLQPWLTDFFSVGSRICPDKALGS
jgi:hypothetical protein